VENLTHWLSSLALLFSTSLFAVAGEEKGYRVEGNESPAVASPQCTEAAKKDRVKGKTVLWLIVTEQGKVASARVVRSLRKDLDREAMKTVKKWIFEPATKDGKPVMVQMNIEINFDCAR
jgi:TonB family protein